MKLAATSKVLFFNETVLLLRYLFSLERLNSDTLWIFSFFFMKP